MLYQTYINPEAKEMNPKLHESVKKYVVTDLAKGGASRTEFNFHEKKIDDLSRLFNWIEDVLPQAAFHFAQGSTDDDYDPTLLGFDPKRFKITECWGIEFNKGDTVEAHNHFPYSMSFCYYVKVPDKDTPLVLFNELGNSSDMMGEAVEIEDGMLCFFHAKTFHFVPPSQSDERCAIVGNILYNPDI